MWTVRALAAACVVAVAAVVAGCGGGESYGSLPPPRAADGSAATAPAKTGPAGTGPVGTLPGGTAPDTARGVPADPSSGTAAGSVEAEVVAQYSRFWVTALPAAAAAPPARRGAILAPVTAEPQLTHLVRSLAALDADGQRNYGADVPVGQTIRVTGGLALVEGCLDSSHSGVANAATGAPVTRGVRRNPVRADLTRGSDGVWRVSAVTYPPGTTC